MVWIIRILSHLPAVKIIVHLRGYKNRQHSHGKQFDDFSRWFHAGRLVTLLMMCSCRTNLKMYVCKHAVGALIHFGLYIISDRSKLENLRKRRVRPKKAGPALSR